jgi:hypothetical protein
MRQRQSARYEEGTGGVNPYGFTPQEYKPPEETKSIAEIAAVVQTVFQGWKDPAEIDFGFHLKHFETWAKVALAATKMQERLQGDLDTESIEPATTLAIMQTVPQSKEEITAQILKAMGLGATGTSYGPPMWGSEFPEKSSGSSNLMPLPMHQSTQQSLEALTTEASDLAPASGPSNLWNTLSNQPTYFGFGPDPQPDILEGGWDATPGGELQDLDSWEKTSWKEGGLPEENRISPNSKAYDYETLEFSPKRIWGAGGSFSQLLKFELEQARMDWETSETTIATLTALHNIANRL